MECGAALLSLRKERHASSLLLAPASRGLESSALIGRPWAAAALEVCSQVFTRCKVSHYSPTNPSVAFPEGDEFSLSLSLKTPKEKYLCMDFYDLKSALPIDLSPGIRRQMRPAAERHAPWRATVLYMATQTSYRQSKNSAANPEKINKWATRTLLCVGVFGLYYSCYSNKLFKLRPGASSSVWWD